MWGRVGKGGEGWRRVEKGVEGWGRVEKGDFFKQDSRGCNLHVISA